MEEKHDDRTEKCFLCDEVKLVVEGLEDYSFSRGHTFTCKECAMKDMTCSDCDNPWRKGQCLIFDYGGRYLCICKECLDKSYILLNFLKDFKANKCLELVNSGFNLLEDKEYVKEIKLEAEEWIKERENETFNPNKDLKDLILDSTDILLSINSDGVLVGGRKDCKEYFKFETDYNYEPEKKYYEFKVQCHGGYCQVIIILLDLKYSLSIYFTEEKVALWLDGDKYWNIPDWIPIEKLKNHCNNIIKTLDIKPCNKKH